MENHDTRDCNCRDSRHDHDYDLEYRNRSTSSCCHHSCSCCCSCGHGCGCRSNNSHCNRNRCRRDLCDDDFRIRLAGLSDGLNYRLHQLLWCDAAISLDNGDFIVGKIIFVGSNFVEMLLPVEEPIEEDIEDESLLDEDLEENEPIMEFEEREHSIGRTLIFSIAKIVTVESDCPCNPA